MKVFLMIGLCLFASIARTETLTVGLADADYPPFYYQDEGSFKGAAIEIAEELASSLGYKLIYRRYPWKRVQHNLRTGAVDMVLLLFKTEKRAQYVVYTDIPYLKERSSLFVPVHLEVTFNGELGSVSQYPFYGIRGYYYGPVYHQATFLDKFDVSNEPELIRKVANPKLNLIGIGNKAAIEYYARQLGMASGIRFLQPDLYEGDNYIAFSKVRVDAHKLAQRFSESLRVYVQGPEYATVLARYGLRP